MGHFIAQREKLHSNLLGLHVERGNWITDGALHNMALGLWSKSAGLEAATGRAIGVMGGRLRLEAYALTFIDGFHVLAWSCVVALLLIALLRRSPLSYGDLGSLQQPPPERRESRPTQREFEGGRLVSQETFRHSSSWIALILSWSSS